MYGDAGNDNLFGQDGNDSLSGGSGSDNLQGGGGDDTYEFNAGDGMDIILDTEGANRIQFNDVSDAGSLNVQYATIGTDNTVVDPNGQDLMIGYSANDTVLIKDGRSNESLFSYDINGILYNLADLINTGGQGQEQHGGSGNDNLHGTEGPDTLYGEDGNDYLWGHGDRDQLLGGSGNDHLIGGSGADVLNGGSGTDFAEYTTSPAAITADLQTGEMHGGDAEGDILISMENLLGSRFNDMLTGDNQRNALWGNEGNDIVYGLGGDDYMQDCYSTQDSGDDTYYGGAGDDHIVGMSGSDRLYGGPGNDTFVFNPGDGIDYINDFEGNNKITFGRPAGITLPQLIVSYAIINNDMTAVTVDPDGSDLLIQYTDNDAIAIVNGRSNSAFVYDLQNTGNTISHADILALVDPGQHFGDADDLVDGTSGDDMIYGGGGNDRIKGNGGNDQLYGEPGNDALYGNDGDDLLSGGAGNDTLIGGAGADILDGGAGRDRADYRYSSASVAVNLATGVAVGGDAEGDTFTGIENLGGSQLADSLTGNDENNSLYGNGGDDLLSGGLGNDYLKGGAGSDTFIFDSALDASANRDTIADFTAGQDRIELDNSIFTALVNEGVLAEANFHADATGVAADDNDYILYNTTTGVLSYDADGSGTGVAVEFARLTSKPDISADDFMIAAG